MKKGKHTILMAAAECRGIAKVGGLGDVVYDLSQRLIADGNEVLVLLPAYQSLDLKASTKKGFLVPFGGRAVSATLKSLSVQDLTVYLIESEFFQGEWGDVYVDSAKRGKGPFEDDALRFAFFSAAVLELLKHHKPFSEVEIVHCHDWHTGLVPLLLLDEGLQKRYSTLFTIHNLDYQGVRPLDDPYGPLASLRQWFPDRFPRWAEKNIHTRIIDPHAHHCFNPMRCGILLSDGVNTVSPTYAREITQPDDETSNFFGGRGLEKDLLERLDQKRLWGILNGLDYEVFDPEKLQPPYHETSEDPIATKALHKAELVSQLKGRLEELDHRVGKRFKNSAAVFQHLEGFLKYAAKKPLVVAVTRAVSQKLGLFLDKDRDGKSVVDAFLERDLALLVIGSGELETSLEALNQSSKALFLCAFDAQLAQDFYSAGDLFLMPSDFEPCGISQLMAMRYGCLPIVHDRGGLHDTVQDGKTGFVFQGTNRVEAIENFLATTDQALKTIKTKTKRLNMVRTAMKQRFDWNRSVLAYEEIYDVLCEST